MKKINVLLLLFVFLTSTVYAGTVNLPKTGQTKCYDTDGYEIACPDTGQDGDIQAGVAWPEPRFTHNGDRTMTDNLTGLMWTKNANLALAPKTWQQALDYCNNLTLADYTDWRLPNVKEMESLANVGEVDSFAYLTAQGFTNVQAWYWSSTSDASVPDYAWDVLMMGVVDIYSKSVSACYVWPVRGVQSGSFKNSAISLPKTGQTKCYDSAGTEISCAGTGQDGEIQAGVAWPEPRFTDNGDGTMTDNLTSLMWTKNVDLPSGIRTWQQALDYCNSLTFADYSDWRLPNVNEIESLVNAGEVDSSVYLTAQGFTNVLGGYYWSSTSFASYLDHAWIVSMWNVFVTSDIKSSIYDYVWPVRGGQVGPLNHWIISGMVIYKGSGLSNVTMTLNGDASQTTATDSNGNYSFTGLADGTYRITPSRNGYKFLPRSRSATVSGSDVANKNFWARITKGTSTP